MSPHSQSRLLRTRPTQAELRVLWDLDAILESWLVPTLLPDYLSTSHAHAPR